MTKSNPEQLPLEIPGPLLLISLEPKWHEEIAAGRKLYEIRRRFITSSCTCLVYVSGNIQELTAVAKFGKPIVAEPTVIADIAEQDRPGSREFIADYLGNREVGYAIPVEAYSILPAFTLDVLKSIEPRVTPPQSYMYAERNPALMELVETSNDWQAAIAARL